MTQPTKDDLIRVLEKCREYFADKADADGDSEGMYANEEMQLQTEVEALLHYLGKKEYTDSARFDTDNTYRHGKMDISKADKLKETVSEQFKRFIKR